MKEYNFEECDLDLLKQHICNYIITNAKKY